MQEQADINDGFIAADGSRSGAEEDLSQGSHQVDQFVSETEEHEQEPE